MTAERPTQGDIILNPLEDGVTHINVYSRGNTLVGRELSNMATLPIKHPEHGHFDTIEGLWWWLSTGKKDDYFRTCKGFDARKNGSKMERRIIQDFREEIKKAIAIKLTTYPRVLARLLGSDLPLTHYYVYGKETENPLVRAANGSIWVIRWLEQVRASKGEAIKQILA